MSSSRERRVNVKHLHVGGGEVEGRVAAANFGIAKAVVRHTRSPRLAHQPSADVHVPLLGGAEVCCVDTHGIRLLNTGQL
eukprot:scaffold249529_cov35-Tisochrysis_lutea.AAC.4